MLQPPPFIARKKHSNLLLAKVLVILLLNNLCVRQIGSCAFLQAVHKYNELADGSLLTFGHIHLHLYSAPARHEHEALRNANDTAWISKNFIAYKQTLSCI